MSCLRHPNVVLFMAASTKPPKLCIVMELMGLGSLFDLLHNELISDLPGRLKIKILYQAAKGMHFLHSSGVVHRDLKSLNLLLDNKWNVKVSDFGLTKFKDSMKKKDSTAQVGSVHWMAPEVLAEQSNVDWMTADVYSYGIIIWEVITRCQPYHGLSPAAVAVAVIREASRPPRFHAGGGISEKEKELERISIACWSQDPVGRPDFLSIMEDIGRVGQRFGVEGVSAMSTNTTTTTSTGTSSSYTGNGGSNNSSGLSINMSMTLTNGYSHTPSVTSSYNDYYNKSINTNNRDVSTAIASASNHLDSEPSSSDNNNSNGRVAHAHLDHMMAVKVPRKDVCFVVCDVMHADDLWHRDPEKAFSTVGTFIRTVKETAFAFKGHIFSSSHLNSGGTFMLSFSTASSAMRFALELQRECSKHEYLSSMTRVGMSMRQGVCRSPGDDKLRYKYVSEDYKYACLACVKAREGHILCTRRFVKASKSEIGAGDSSTTSAMAASGIAHTLAVDLSRIRWVLALRTRVPIHT
jgi:serine/threonine protein kinase